MATARSTRSIPQPVRSSARSLTARANAVKIDGLHGLIFGNGSTAGATNTLFFTAGPVNGTQGLARHARRRKRLAAGPLVTNSSVTIAEAALKASVVNVLAVEGNPFVGVVANFTDDNPFSVPGDFTAMINWGDGTISAGMVEAGNDAGFVHRRGGHRQQPPCAHLCRRDRLSGPRRPAQHLGHDHRERRRDGGDGRRLRQCEPIRRSCRTRPPWPRRSRASPRFGAVEGSRSVNPFDPVDPIPVAAFLDTNPGAAADRLHRQRRRPASPLIDWGDGSAGLGQVISTGRHNPGQRTAGGELRSCRLPAQRPAIRPCIRPTRI